MKRSEMAQKLKDAGFDWDLSQMDNDGQIIIYTGLMPWSCGEGVDPTDPNLIPYVPSED